MIEVVAREAADLAEGPLWDDQRQCLWWVDIEAGVIHRDGEVFARLDVPVGAIALREDGNLVLAAGLGFATYDVESGALDWIGTVEVGRRMNDAKCDPAGRLFAGTLVGEDQPGGAALYCLQSKEIREVAAGATISNGLGWSPDGTLMYYTDTPLDRVDVFDYDVATGSVSDRRTFLDLSEFAGRPDGMAVDAEGCLWIAMARGGASIRCFTPSGELDRVLELPVSTPTSVAFGGAGLRDLYITTSRMRDPDEPLAGSVLRVPDVGVCGLPISRFPV